MHIVALPKDDSLHNFLKIRVDHGKMIIDISLLDGRTIGSI